MKGGKWDNCNSINSETLKKKKKDSRDYDDPRVLDRGGWDRGAIEQVGGLQGYQVTIEGRKCPRNCSTVGPAAQSANIGHCALYVLDQDLETSPHA